MAYEDYMVKVHIRWEQEIDGICGENVWATPLRHGNYRLENTPLDGEFDFHDIVKAREKDGQLVVTKLVIKGNYEENLH